MTTDRLISLNAAIEAVNDKWPFDHKRHLISALRALPDAGAELREELNDAERDVEMWVHAQQYPRD